MKIIIKAHSFKSRISFLCKEMKEDIPGIILLSLLHLCTAIAILASNKDMFQNDFVVNMGFYVFVSFVMSSPIIKHFFELNKSYNQRVSVETSH